MTKTQGKRFSKGAELWWIEDVGARLALSSGSKRSKHVRLTEALRTTIRKRNVAMHDPLPAERALASGLGMSLGTVRKALENLAIEGIIVRELGRGTFVSEHRGSYFGGPWVHHFVKPDGTDLLPVRTALVYRRITYRKGPWSDALGSDPEGYVCIVRRVTAGENIMSFTRVWLPGQYCRAVLDIPAATLAGENIRITLSERFDLPAMRAQQRIRADVLDPVVCRQFGLPPRTVGMIMEQTAFTHGDRPIFYGTVATRPSHFNMIQELVGGRWN